MSVGTVTDPGGRMITDDIWRLSIYSQLSPQIAIITSAWRVNSITGLGARAGIVAQDILTSLSAAILSLTSGAAAMLGAKMNAIRSALPRPRTGIVSWTASGGSGPFPLPLQMAGIISTHANGSGRSMRGRMYVGFASTDDLDTDGTPLAAYVTNLNSLAARFMAAITTTDGADTSNSSPVIYHRAHNTADDIISASGHKKWAAQHRRGDYGKANSPSFP